MKANLACESFKCSWQQTELWNDRRWKPVRKPYSLICHTPASYTQYVCRYDMKRFFGSPKPTLCLSLKFNQESPVPWVCPVMPTQLTGLVILLISDPKTFHCEFEYSNNCEFEYSIFCLQLFWSQDSLGTVTGRLALICYRYSPNSMTDSAGLKSGQCTSKFRVIARLGY